MKMKSHLFLIVLLTGFGISLGCDSAPELPASAPADEPVDEMTDDMAMPAP